MHISTTPKKAALNSDFSNDHLQKIEPWKIVAEENFQYYQDSRNKPKSETKDETVQTEVDKEEFREG